MGKILDFGYKSPNSTKFSDQVQRPAAVPVSPTERQPVPKAVKLRKVREALASAEPKAKPKASSRWAEYGRRGGRVGGPSTSPAKVAAVRTNGARGGRPRTAS